MTRYLQERTLFPPLINEPPADDLSLAVVIPARDEPDLIRSLESLAQCQAPDDSAEVIVIVNTSETDSEPKIETNQHIAAQAREWAAAHSSPKLHFHILEQHRLPKKHAGVGLARKIGMDEAAACPKMG